LDVRKRPVVSRSYNELGHCAETFLVYGSEARVDEWSYGGPPQFRAARAVASYGFEDGHLTSFTQLRPDGSTAEALEWRDGRLAALHRRSKNPDFELTYRLESDDAGELGSVAMERPGGIRGIVYTAPKKSEAALAKSVRARLVDSIPGRVRDLRVAETACCLALVYDPASLLSMLPPKLALGLESERKARLAGKGASQGPSLESLWDAQGFATFDDPRLDLADAGLLSECRQLAERYRSEGGERKAHELLIEVCRALNRLRWSDHTPVTADFVVYPVDLETAHLREDITRAVPAKLVAKLRRAGVL
ncbi:MAG: hypothetical protein ACRELB_09415, partial [Polyangiaceae bacterium]